jgi:hypothetical protein
MAQKLKLSDQVVSFAGVGLRSWASAAFRWAWGAEALSNALHRMSHMLGCRATG